MCLKCNFSNSCLILSRHSPIHPREAHADRREAQGVDLEIKDDYCLVKVITQQELRKHLYN